MLENKRGSEFLTPKFIAKLLLFLGVALALIGIYMVLNGRMFG